MTEESSGPAARPGRKGALLEHRGAGVSDVQHHLLRLHGPPETRLGGSQAAQATHEILKNHNVRNVSHHAR